MSDTELFKLTAATLAKLDRGTLKNALNHAIDKVIADCIDRAADDRPRKVEFSLEVTPTTEYDPDTKTVCLTGAVGKYKVRAKIPDHESPALDFGITNDGKLVFNTNHPQDVHQRTLPGMDGSEIEEDSEVEEDAEE